MCISLASTLRGKSLFWARSGSMKRRTVSLPGGMSKYPSMLMAAPLVEMSNSLPDMSCP